MNKIGFIIFKSFAKGIAKTPFTRLYVKSDFYAFLIYKVIRYRRKVVRTNLLNSFPDKSLEEIKEIEKQFYYNFSDLMLETCKLMVLKPEELEKHVRFSNPEVIQDLYKEGKSVFIMLPHSGNWEWFGKLLHNITPHRTMAIYKRLNDPYMEQFMHELRTNYHFSEEQMIEAKTALRTLVRMRDTKNAVLILGDQSPRGVESDYWCTFMHQDTVWFTGPEKMAKLLDYSVVFAEMSRRHRGYYEVKFKEICKDSKETSEGYIMNQQINLLENYLTVHPDNWLWSHRRWKHKRQQIA